MIIIDTHIHLYRQHNLKTALKVCAARLAALAPQATCAAVLTERAGENFFEQLESGQLHLPDDCALRVVEKRHCLKIESTSVASLYLFAGRQIVTAERLELLCLGINAAIPDGLPAADAVLRIRETGGVAVLTWAVGKWLFRRKKVVNRLLEEFAPQELLIGDSAMRPVFWPAPAAMQTALLQQRRIIAGSDPLPAPGEERVMGSYATLLEEADLNETHPFDSLAKALTAPQTGSRNLGRRCGPLEFFDRMRAAKG